MTIIPTTEILMKFRLNGTPHKLEGASGTTYFVDGYVVKHYDSSEYGNFICNIYSNILQKGFKVPSPIRSENGCYLESGWMAYPLIKGFTSDNRIQEKLALSEAFHEQLLRFKYDKSIENKDDHHKLSEKIAWGEKLLLNEIGQVAYDKISILLMGLVPIPIANQLIHGDFFGNVIFSEDGIPTVIDLSPQCRPRKFSHAILMFDSILYGKAKVDDFGKLLADEFFTQILLRAIIFRLCATAIFDALNERSYFTIELKETIDRFESIVPSLTKLR